MKTLSHNGKPLSNPFEPLVHPTDLQLLNTFVSHVIVCEFGSSLSRIQYHYMHRATHTKHADHGEKTCAISFVGILHAKW
jgi:hypothetical protein